MSMKLNEIQNYEKRLERACGLDPNPTTHMLIHYLFINDRTSWLYVLSLLSADFRM